MIDVIVSGAGGRMGQEVVAAVGAEADMRVVARVDPALPEAPDAHPDLAGALAGGTAQVMVDFTRPDTVAENVRQALAAGVHAVVGTTGMSDAQIGELAEVGEGTGANLLVAANFAVGAVLMMRFAREASRHSHSVGEPQPRAPGGAEVDPVKTRWTRSALPPWRFRYAASRPGARRHTAAETGAPWPWYIWSQTPPARASPGNTPRQPGRMCVEPLRPSVKCCPRPRPIDVTSAGAR